MRYIFLIWLLTLPWVTWTWTLSDAIVSWAIFLLTFVSYLEMPENRPGIPGVRQASISRASARGSVMPSPRLRASSQEPTALANFERQGASQIRWPKPAPRNVAKVKDATVPRAVDPVGTSGVPFLLSINMVTGTGVSQCPLSEAANH